MLPDDFHNFNHRNTEDVLEQLFNELFREYEHRLYLLVLKMLKSDTMAKDIVQDVFLKLWVIREKIPEIKNISSFLYRLTENKVIDHLRSSACDQKKKAALWRGLCQTNVQDTGRYVEDKEYNAIIQRAIEQLPPQRKAVYLLSKAENISRKEVASLLQISPNTVRNQLAKAIENITSYLKSHN